MHPNALSFPPVSVRHRSFSIDVPSIDLSRGEILGIFGKSGSGKTTYLKKIRECFPSENVLYMSQFDCLLEEITIRQNIELGLVCTAKPSSELAGWERHFASLLGEFEVDKHLHKYPRMMSGGQRKRAEIVRSLMMDPEILLLDEPFQGIGHLFESVSTKYILQRSQKKSGVTVIVSHDFDLLCKFSNRILLVDDRGVIEIAPTADKNWKPTNLRAAWTLGVENLIPPTALPALQANIDVPSQHMLAFWGRQARWGSAGACSLKIRRSDVTSERTFLRYGEPYTQVEVSVKSGKPLLLVGAGTTERAGDLSLGVTGQWIVEDNERNP